MALVALPDFIIEAQRILNNTENGHFGVLQLEIYSATPAQAKANYDTIKKVLRSRESLRHPSREVKLALAALESALAALRSHEGLRAARDAILKTRHSRVQEYEELEHIRNRTSELEARAAMLSSQ